MRQRILVAFPEFRLFRELLLCVQVRVCLDAVQFRPRPLVRKAVAQPLFKRPPVLDIVREEDFPPGPGDIFIHGAHRVKILRVPFPGVPRALHGEGLPGLPRPARNLGGQRVRPRLDAEHLP